MEDIRVDNLKGGWSTYDPTTIDDNQLSVATNMYYDSQLFLTHRKGIASFGTAIPDAVNMHSLEFFKLSDGSRHLLCGSGTDVYEFDEGTDAWVSIKSGLTDGLKLCFYIYKDIMYWTNGTDNVMSYDGTTVAEHAGVQKGKYAFVANDIAYMAGISTDASTVFYSASNPTDLKSAYANFEPINEDDGQIITAMRGLGALMFIGKDHSTYKLNTISSPVTVERLDHDGGVASHRCWSNVENDLMHMAENGVFKLSQRKSTVGSYRVWAETNMIQSVIDLVDNKGKCVSAYYPEARNMYLAYGTTGENNGMLVYCVLNRAWTNYEGVSALDFTLYEDATGKRRLLCSTPYGGQCFELETGSSDDDVAIRSKMSTKSHDFGKSESLKTIAYVDTIGRISKQQTIKISINIDGQVITKTVYGGDFATTATGFAIPLGVEQVGVFPVGGGEAGPDTIQVYEFIVRIPLYLTGRRVKISVEGDGKYSTYQVLKYTIFAEGQPIDLFPSANIY